MSQMMDRIVRSLLDCLFCGNSSWTGSILQFSSNGIANGRGKKSRLHYSRMKFSFKFYLLYLYVSGTRSHLHREGRNVSSLLLEFCMAHRTLLVIPLAGSQGQPLILLVPQSLFSTPSQCVVASISFMHLLVSSFFGI